MRERKRNWEEVIKVNEIRKGKLENATKVKENANSVRQHHKGEKQKGLKRQ